MPYVTRYDLHIYTSTIKFDYCESAPVRSFFPEKKTLTAVRGPPTRKGRDSIARPHEPQYTPPNTRASLRAARVFCVWFSPTLSPSRPPRAEIGKLRHNGVSIADVNPLMALSFYVPFPTRIFPPKKNTGGKRTHKLKITHNTRIRRKLENHGAHSVGRGRPRSG